MSYRGLWIHLACVAIAVAAFQLASDRYAFQLVTAALLGAGIGAAVFAVDYHRHIRQYQRERDEFNRQLKDQG